MIASGSDESLSSLKDFTTMQLVFHTSPSRLLRLEIRFSRPEIFFSSIWLLAGSAKR